MQILKQNYIKYLQDISEVLNSIKFDSTKQEGLINTIKQTELLVPVIGGFSAGKSTLINSFLRENILSTGIAPETALATELRYNDDSYFEVVKENGEVDKFTINDTELIKQNAGKYQFLRLYLNNEHLKAIAPLVLVDMPGFDSPVELHNKAILNYLSKGKYFIVLISAEDGNITKSIFREIDNIMEFGKGFSFCISKANLRPESDVKLIQEKIKEQLKDSFDYDKEVLAIGLDDGDELDKILKNINTKELFKAIFIDELKSNNFAVQSSIDTNIATLENKEEDTTNAIKELNLNIEKIASKKESAIENLQSKYSDSKTNNIINSVARAIMADVDILANYAASNQESFKSELNSIVKNAIITSVKNEMSDITVDIVKDFSFEIKNMNLSEFKIDDVWIEKISDQTVALLQKAQNGLISLVEDLNQKDGGKIYKAITTILGVTTTIINPMLEIVIIFLPEIIKFFSQSYNENKKIEQAKNQIISNIIPSIKTKLREEMPILLNEQIKAIIEVVSSKFDEQLKQKEEEISKALSEKSNNIKELEAQISELKNAKDKIISLATQNLYN